MNKRDSFFRRYLPSTATLSRNPLFRIAGRLCDGVCNRFFPEFRDLPPNHLRVRVGVRNKVFLNQVLCIKSGYNFWLHAFAARLCDLNSQIVELGCGYGRKAMHLRNFYMQGTRFTGHYVGIDVDHEQLDYARTHFPAPQFQFFASSHASKTYAANGGRSGDDSRRAAYRIPVEDNSQDFVFSTSLLTHLLEPELRNYLHESQRILRPGGWMQMNVFAFDYMSSRGLLGNRWKFPHRLGNALVESVEYPEAAVAYHDRYLVDLVRELGFAHCEVISDPEGQTPQSFLRCRKG